MWWHKYYIELKWTGIFASALLLWMFAERMVGLHSVHVAQHPLYTSLFAIVAVAIYILALREKRDRAYSGEMSWQQGFHCGLRISVLVAVLSPLLQWIIHRLISPHFFTNAATHAVQSGKMTPAEAGQYFDLSSYIIQATIGALLMGVITSALVAFFVRSRRPD
ncbi:DUF4199 domain-containing protein [Aliidiomarina soli]|uniref:DUF4199 domain-containing protein n=1 Tax=Aliidiomarina soli TaxID=1928574 RepID=A0A432WFC9_9GAMM|nr:DUF4199 domain-containing protein [Aliidiomarina soli]RUO32506.1 DUF4199 domain-containing protein [Aliidiomarina soli]